MMSCAVLKRCAELGVIVIISILRLSTVREMECDLPTGKLDDVVNACPYWNDDRSVITVSLCSSTAPIVFRRNALMRGSGFDDRVGRQTCAVSRTT